MKNRKSNLDQTLDRPEPFSAQSPIRICLLDDNPDDRLLVMREMRRSFPKLKVEEITGPEQFEELKIGPEPDLIITDYQICWTDGLSVLRSAKCSWPDCPVIMFTGTGSEEIAVEAMKSGLDDYVIKTPKHFTRLSSAIQLSLKLGRQRKELSSIENRFSTLFNSIPVGLYLASPDGTLHDANPALIELLGYPDRETLLKSSHKLYDGSQQYEEWVRRMETHGVIRNFEMQVRCASGKLCWVKNSALAVRNPKFGTVYYEGSMENITARKSAEEEREKLILELQDALAKIKTLSGLLPICSACKKIRDDKGYWNQIEEYIETHSDAEFTHSFCPECVKRLYPEVMEVLEEKNSPRP